MLGFVKDQQHLALAEIESQIAQNPVDGIGLADLAHRHCLVHVLRHRVVNNFPSLHDDLAPLVLEGCESVIEHPGICSVGAFDVDLVYELIDVVPVDYQTLHFKMAAYAFAAYHGVLHEDASNALAIIVFGFS